MGRERVEEEERGRKREEGKGGGRLYHPAPITSSCVRSCIQIFGLLVLPVVSPTIISYTFIITCQVQTFDVCYWQLLTKSTPR